MPRPVWFDASAGGGKDVALVAAHLEASAEAAQAPLRFEPVTLPPGADLKVLHQAALLRARRSLALAHSELDRILAQEVRAIDDLVRTANLLVERLREWYALHAPEATRAVPGSEDLARLVATHGGRDAVMAQLDQAKAAATSLGTDLEDADVAVLQGFAQALASVHASWTALEARVAELMQTVAPNVASVVGPVIGARLIALSGGLERLASWPAGTVQLLGAETALFRHLKEGTKPPKHGILFQHPQVHQAAPWSRGAVARALALAASTAAKADAFTKNDLREHLAAQVKADMERISKRRMPAKPRGGFGRGPPPQRRPWGAPPPFRQGPPGQSGPPQRAPPPRAFGNPSDAPPGGPSGGPPRTPWRAPRDKPWPGKPQGGPGGGGGRDGPRDDAPRGPPRGGGWGGPGGGGGPGRGPPKPFRRKPQGAFRSDNKPARPPGRGGQGGGDR